MHFLDPSYILLLLEMHNTIFGLNHTWLFHKLDKSILHYMYHILSSLVRSDNSTIVDGNYSTYNGMRVALLNGNTRNEEFADFADNKGFTYVPSYFDTTTEMDEALQSEKVDAIVTSSLRKTNNERIVEKFGSSDFYVIVKKGNTELLNEINYAIDQMNAVEGDWKTTLYNKNYESIETKNLEYTEKEKSIISQYSKDNPLHVLCDPTRYLLG